MPKRKSKVHDERLDDITSGKMPYLKVRATTWFRDSYGLFDYDSDRITKTTTKFYDSIHMNRIGDGLQLTKKKDEDTFLTAAYHQGKYFLASPATKEENYSLKPFMHANMGDENSDGYTGIKLKRGQVLKFGRYVFRVNEISVEKDKKDPVNTEVDPDMPLTSRSNRDRVHGDEEQNEGDFGDTQKNMLPLKKLRTISEEPGKDIVCRICLSEDNSDQEDPLISPCKCSGTMKFIHLKCLTEWLESKKSSKDGVHFRSFLWEHIICELCKVEFKSYVYNKGKRIDLLDYEVPKNGHYLVLEAINTEEIMKKKTKIIHIVDFKKKSRLILGRGNEAHVKISDISISRSHAKLRVIRNKEIWIEDSHSKFGSMLLYDEPIIMDKKNYYFGMQVGRTYLSISLYYPMNLCCCKTDFTSLRKGFPAYIYYHDFPPKIKALVAPTKPKVINSEPNEDDIIEYSEKNTNSNLIDPITLQMRQPHQPANEDLPTERQPFEEEKNLQSRNSHDSHHNLSVNYEETKDLQPQDWAGSHTPANPDATNVYQTREERKSQQASERDIEWGSESKASKEESFKLENEMQSRDDGKSIKSIRFGTNSEHGSEMKSKRSDNIHQMIKEWEDEFQSRASNVNEEDKVTPFKNMDEEEEEQKSERGSPLDDDFADLDLEEAKSVAKEDNSSNGAPDSHREIMKKERSRPSQFISQIESVAPTPQRKKSAEESDEGHEDLINELEDLINV